MTLREAGSKFLEEFTSMKYQLVYLGTALFFFGKLSESGWLVFTLSITGFRAVNEISGMIKDVRTLPGIGLTAMKDKEEIKK